MKTNSDFGLIAAPLTPFHADGSLNLDPVPAYARWLHQQGVSGAFVCGTTGEGVSLTMAERLQVAEHWVRAAPAGLRVIVHVGHNALADCRQLAAHAAQIGASAVACMPPVFFKPAGVAGLVNWCAAVAAAAPGLPFYYYHIPAMTGVDLPMADFLPAASARIANFAGIKFTYEDLDDYQRCVAYADGAYAILFGRDELLLSALRIGARGAVGSTYNFAAPLYLRLIDNFVRGDAAAAEACQRQAVQMLAACCGDAWHPLAAFKWLMRAIGVDCGPPRLPIDDLTPDQQQTLAGRLRACGIEPLPGGLQFQQA
jgi:N-acetylneuraminate lyase